MSNININAASLMRSEALSIPDVVQQVVNQENEIYADLIKDLKQRDLHSIATIARGSSDHAASFMSYLLMARLGLPVTSIPMSLVTLYKAKLGAPHIAAFAFSQSGQSPDLIETLKVFAHNGSPTVAVVNAPNSPLADASHYELPLHCGLEKSVAATKSFMSELVVGLKFIALWQEDKVLLDALQQLPECLRKAGEQDWSAIANEYANTDRLCILGRGPCHSIAMEGALKFKETCGIQAEAFSGAEFKHGPMGLINEDFQLLVLAPRGVSQPMMIETAAEMKTRGAKVLLAATEGLGGDLLIPQTMHPELDSIAAILCLYLGIEQLARKRGLNPDQPPQLSKVTKTT